MHGESLKPHAPCGCVSPKSYTECMVYYLLSHVEEVAVMRRNFLGCLKCSKLDRCLHYIIVCTCQTQEIHTCKFDICNHTFKEVTISTC
jgi:hypothetical protein